MNVVRRDAFVIIILLMVIIQGVPARGQTQPPDYHFADSTMIARFPFDLYLNLIFIGARINDSDSLWLCLDSGAEGTIINSTVIRNLGVIAEGEHREDAPGGDVNVSFADSLDFHFPGVDVVNQRVMVIPLDDLEPVIGRRFDGILGHDYFERFIIDIDYGQRIITFLDTTGYNYSGPGTVVPVIIENREPFLFGYLESQDHPPVRAKLKLDTGSMDVLGLNGFFVKGERLFGPSQKSIPIPGVGLGGHTKNYVTRLKNLQVGDIVVENAVVGFSDDTSHSDNAGTIAGELFRRFRMIFDYTRNRVIMEKTERLSEPYEFDMSGIFPVAERPDFKTIRIVYVAENSPGSDAGIQKGDIILSIDGRPAGEFNIGQIRNMFKTADKTYRLEIERSMVKSQAILTTRRLI